MVLTKMPCADGFFPGADDRFAASQGASTVGFAWGSWGVPMGDNRPPKFTHGTHQNRSGSRSFSGCERSVCSDGRWCSAMFRRAGRSNKRNEAMIRCMVLPWTRGRKRRTWQFWGL